ncbi:alkaline phosphatase family protein [Halodesulfovibrio sp.]|jgi:2,3-bisphosphoglycerate-independent phosphoglycerate mutase|uniref:alkaline phosphatase family protein n=1 Tax=Halodesulfovibrio sp. TaxID=1912772 RepID=UPI0025FEF20E|nr:alkaline phosphatase family protein [Halodesulfovibrio sp.]MCT4534396.1 alkaline phosphatase family protein [Halodesulfovibrio sp.]
MHKIIVCIADGAADAPSLCPEGTPLERANTPVLDIMTRHSVAGLCYTIPAGFSPDSDVGNMSLLGYNPTIYHQGRAPIEAQALGISARSDDLIWRVTLCCTENDLITTPCASSITSEEAQNIVAALNNAFAHHGNLTVVANKSYRLLLLQKDGHAQLKAHNKILRNKKLPELQTGGPHMLQQTPLQAQVAQYPEQLQQVIKTAPKVLSQYTDKTNCMWLWGQGSPYSLPSFPDKHGTNGCIISGTPLLHGLGHMAGMDVIKDTSFTGLPDTNLAKKAYAAISYLQAPENTIAFIHVDAPDHYGHIGDAKGKRSAIERIDAELLPVLLREMPEACIAVTADHLTPATTKAHARGAVPFIAYHPTLPKQTTVRRFTELECKKGVHLAEDTLLLNVLKTLR